MALAHANTEYLFSGVVMRSILTGRETDGRFCLFANRSGGTRLRPFTYIRSKMKPYMFSKAKWRPSFPVKPLRHMPGKPFSCRVGYRMSPSGFEEFVAIAGREQGPADTVETPSAEEIARMKEAAPDFGVALLCGF